MKLSIVMPVFNERETLLPILKKVQEVDLGNVQKEIILVDDASYDGTTELLHTLQKDQPDLKIYFKEVNEGKGAALKTGFEYSTGDYVIVQDADLEYDPKDYVKLLKALETENADVVYGSRFSGDYKDMSSLHFRGNKILTLITNLVYGTHLTDMETCYKLLPGKFVRKLDIKSKRFNFEPEITAKILKSKLKITEAPISYVGRTHVQGKKITWKDGISALYTIIKFRIFN